MLVVCLPACQFVVVCGLLFDVSCWLFVVSCCFFVLSCVDRCFVCVV